MKRLDLIRQLEQGGSVFIRHDGRHDWYQNPKKEPVSQYHDTVKSKTILHATFSAK